ncbi:MAG: primosomal protein N' [Candidatus Babeliales bacterium]
MFVQVRLLRGYSEPLWYEVAEELCHGLTVGSLIHVPFRTGSESALIEHITAIRPTVSFAIKQIAYKEPVPADGHYASFLQQIARYQQIPLLACAKRLRSFLREKPHEIAIEAPTVHETKRAEVVLTHEQQICADAITSAIDENRYAPFVLHGVTGSGKTEIYKTAINHAYAQGKSVLLLLPEVTLAVQFTQILQASLANRIPVYGFHSATSIADKRTLWQRLLRNEPLLIIGVHLPIFLPITNLGLIIVDEEHETGFQEKKHPKINSKDAAVIRASVYNIPIVLGSATPSISTLYNVEKKGWRLLQLHQRYAGTFPRVQVVPLNTGKQRKQFWITPELMAAIAERLERREQTILFINRRGHSFFVQCRNCATVFSCTACSVSLTLHEDEQLRCHYCGYSTALPTRCATCQSGSEQFLKKGIGTQQAMQIIQQLFRHARVARADMDATVNRKKWQQTVDAMHAGTIDILVGTQTITKGYHFSRVTLVGVLWADLDLHMPLYNATEHALQQLIQVAGRAGRATDNGLVIVQTMSDHSLFSHLSELQYRDFYTQEIAIRALVGYPPCVRLAEIELKSGDERLVTEQAELLFDELSTHNDAHAYRVKLLGPTLPPVHKIQHMHTRKIYLKSTDIQSLLKLFQCIDLNNYPVAIYFTPNPVTL